ncbi:ABC transporter permease [Acidihalobacter ferrooxydans]|uniref:Glycine/betaine ABC transporter n=1 Tax=Acidihalobacter ferrooxydans TaxID=1765967 RepID=A0A1P8UKH2_9GAMM|nr:proline/glycine betaine ABC transporter permease [Acidihalobacter ferrooxydans]APZ44337.1 glycine/betaine ABC transporter [Acidihalobacter ferrooxydans]
MNFQLGQPLPIGEGVSHSVNYLTDHYAGAFNAITAGVHFLIAGLTNGLLALPPFVFVAAIGAVSVWLLGWRRKAGWGLGVFSVLGLLLVLNLGYWAALMETLALVLAAEIMVVIIGLPLGIIGGRSELADRIMRPVLDIMQTMPAFVYLVPAVIFFGLGLVPGVISTVIFALPPLIRLTTLGIRQVPHELVEASNSFGATWWQMLIKVQLPSALPSIMAGVNQSIMLGLSMVVIASMIGAGGLGNVVLQGINQLDVGKGFVGGLAVVILAIILDRITQSFGQKRNK